MSKEKVALFLDNAGCHHANFIKQLIMNWDVAMVFNSPKTPIFNPAELVIAFVKSKTRI